jgi:mono/diheme cytochrome c family protein
MRRRPWAIGFVIFLGLVLSGGGYAAATNVVQAEVSSADQVAEGRKLFLANCASCHGSNGEGAIGGPSLIGVGAASVDFQVGTGRMPGQASGPQLYKKPVQFTEEQISAMAAYVASLAPGPAIPDAEYLRTTGDDIDMTHGSELFRINCAMCHNAVGAGGALVRAGNTILTPEGAYVQAGDSFLKPAGGAVVRAGNSYVGTDSALVKVGNSPNLILIGSDGASIGAGNTILRPLFLPH